jgi:hypothetical protein
MNAIRNPRDFWSGVLFILLGGGACLIALDYAMGSAGRMGPGYFPRTLGLMLSALGAGLVLRALRTRGAALSFPTFRPILVVLTSVLLFGLTVNEAGLVVSTLLMVLVASVASHDYRPRESLVAAVALAIFVVVTFRYGLGIQLPTWPAALEG